MNKISTGILALLVASVGCGGADEPTLKYNPTSFGEAEILTTALLRYRNLDSVGEISDAGLNGKAAELELIARVKPATAVRLDDRTIWYPATRAVPDHCDRMTTLQDFELCVLDVKELDGLNAVHREWAKRYLEVFGAEVMIAETARTAPAPVEEEKCEDVVISEPAPPTPSLPLKPQTDVTPYSADCPCTRTTLFHGKKHKQADPQTWAKYKHSGTGEVKWAPQGGSVGGGFEATGETAFRDWTRQLTSCKVIDRDQGSTHRGWYNPCRWFGYPCSPCDALSAPKIHTEDALTVLYTFDPKQGKFVIETFPDPCGADNTPIGPPVTW